MVQRSDRTSQAVNAIKDPNTQSGFRTRPSINTATTVMPSSMTPATRLKEPTSGNGTASHGVVKTKTQSRKRLILRMQPKHFLELIEHDVEHERAEGVPLDIPGRAVQRARNRMAE